MLLKLRLDSLLLGDALQCKEVLFGIVSNQKNVTKLALAQLLRHLKIFKMQFLAQLC